MQTLMIKETLSNEKRCIQLCQSYKKLLFKTNFRKVDRYTGVKWLIHVAKHRRDNQLQSLELTCKIS